jgi:ClpP class serine protease
MTDLLSLLNASNLTAIPLQITQTTQTNWSQFGMLIFTALLSSAFLIYFLSKMFARSFSGFLVKRKLRWLKRLTKRHILFIKHTEMGLFGESMIGRDTLRDVTRALTKFAGKPFDLIIHTPGGEIFSSQLIARMFKQYPGQIRTIIPLYSMSGGTFLSLSTDQLVMPRTASLGPIDPQLGNLFKFGSAKAWDKIVKFKGKKAEDQSISFALMGKQYTKTIRKQLMTLIKFNMSEKDKRKFVNFLTSGDIEHGYPITPLELRGFGVPVKLLNPQVAEKLWDILSRESFEGVHYL